MKRWIGILILHACYSTALATMTIAVEPSTIQLGETSRITITQDNAQSASVPDLTPLEQSFIIEGTERSVSYTVINGQARSVRQWSVLVRAKKIGIIPIPAIQMGQEYSVPSQITVTASNTTPNTPDNSAAPPGDDEVMLVTSVGSKKPYINEQVIYTVKLFNRQRLLDADYQPPRIDDALVIPLGEGLHYQTQINGHTYGVEEQQYAIFPQKSGDLQITPPSLTALVYDAPPRRVHRQGSATQLAVKPMPAQSLPHNWLPAKQVTLTEQYDHDDSIMTEGNTVVRTIILQATAVPAQLLPVLTFAGGEQFSVYPENPAIKNVLQSQALMGSTTVNVTYVLNKSGRIVLPAIHLPWFNTVTGRDEVASLPARSITVKAKASTHVPATIISVRPKAISKSLVAGVSRHGYHPLAWIITACVFVAIGVFARYGVRRQPALTARPSHGAVLKRLRDACATNDPIEVKAALMNWAAIQWPDAQLFNLTALTELIHDTRLKQQLSRLSHALYSHTDKQAWRGDALWRAMTTFKPGATFKKYGKDRLPPINPLDKHNV